LNKKNTNKESMLLLIGTLPEPIGGVSIHTERLLFFLKKNNFNHSFYDYKKNSFKRGVKLFFNSKLIHIHANNQLFLFLMSLLCFMFFKKLIITVHGEYNCKGRLDNFLESMSMTLSSVPILLNEIDYNKVKILNSQSLMITSFIPPLKQPDLSIDVVGKIKNLKNLTKSIFCSNAYMLAYDFNGKEIYGITELINFFNNNIDFGFIFSDPSGDYSNYFNSNNIILNKNIIVINKSHSFFKVLELSDCFVRNTTTDGDSISLREALFLNKETYATNCVQRPKGVNILTDLSLLIKDNNNNINHVQNNGAEDLLKLYKSLLID
jgi:hypothetical protein